MFASTLAWCVATVILTILCLVESARCAWNKEVADTKVVYLAPVLTNPFVDSLLYSLFHILCKQKVSPFINKLLTAIFSEFSCLEGEPRAVIRVRVR